MAELIARATKPLGCKRDQRRSRDDRAVPIPTARKTATEVAAVEDVSAKSPPPSAPNRKERDKAIGQCQPAAMIVSRLHQWIVVITGLRLQAFGMDNALSRRPEDVVEREYG